MRVEDPTIAGLLKAHGYATGQFGKNHLGDKDEFLPTNHGFDEFFGNLYHLNAEEEPENEDYRDMVTAEATFRETFGPRGVIHSYADGRIEDTGPLTRKRMETVDDETVGGGHRLHRAPAAAGKPVLRVVERHPHALPHPREGGAPRHLRPGRVRRRHGRARHARRPVPRSFSTSSASPTTRSSSTAPTTGRTRTPGPTPPRRPSAARRTRNWEGGWRVPAMVRWPGKIEPGSVTNEIVHHMDWLPTFVAAAGEPDIKEELSTGYTSQALGRTYKVHLDGYDIAAAAHGQDREEPAQRDLLLLGRRRPDGAALRRLEADLHGAEGAGHASASGWSRSCRCGCR